MATNFVRPGGPSFFCAPLHRFLAPLSRIRLLGVKNPLCVHHRVIDPTLKTRFSCQSIDDFCKSHHICFKTTSRHFKTAPAPLQDVPRLLRGAPRPLQDASRTLQDRPKTAPRRFKTASGRFKKTPRQLQDAPRPLHDVPRPLQDTPRRLQGTQDRSKTAPRPPEVSRRR